ncbi:Mur ligase family protein, partial [Staphylococcus capitis]|uniref:Mur ligase family protein n=1 Tax=Staphylococcus capitis TaxID=29388 RepID=UPI0021B295EB
NNQIRIPLTVLHLDQHTQISILQIPISPFHHIHLLSSIPQPHIPVITNIPQSHIQDLASRDGIAKANSEITIPLK